MKFAPFSFFDTPSSRLKVPLPRIGKDSMARPEFLVEIRKIAKTNGTLVHERMIFAGQRR